MIHNFDIIDENIVFENKEKQKLNFPKIKNIYYENYKKTSKGKIVKEFIKLFFNINKLKYLNEGYNDKDEIIYINYSKEMDFDIIKKLKTNLSKIIIEYENIKITYNKEIKELIIINESLSKKLDKNFFNDLIKLYDLLTNYYKTISYNIEKNLKKKIIFEKIKRNTILTKKILIKLSNYINFFKYYPYKVSMDYLINYYLIRKFLLVIETQSNIKFYLNINNEYGFIYCSNYIHDIYNYNNKPIIKKKEGEILSLEIGKVVLKFNENNVLIELKDYFYGSAYIYYVKNAELYQL